MLSVGKTTARVTFHLLTAKVLSRLVGIITGLVLIRLLGPNYYGNVGIALVVASNFAVLTQLGIRDAATRFIARTRSAGETGQVKRLFYSSLVFNLVLGTLILVAGFLAAPLVMSLLVRRPDLVYLAQVSSALILGWFFLDYSQNVLLGFDRSKGYAFLQLLYEIANGILPILLAITLSRTAGPVLGWTVATVFAAAVGVFLCMRVVHKESEKGSSKLSSQTVSSMFRFQLPLGLDTLFRTGAGNLYFLVIAIYVVPFDIGVYAAAASLILVLNYVSTPFNSALLPAFAKLIIPEKYSQLKEIFRYSIKYSSMLVLPAAFLLLALSGPIFAVLLGSDYASRPIFLSLLAIAWLPYGLGYGQYSQLFVAQGKTRLVAMLDGLGLAIGIPLSLLVIPLSGITGFLVLSIFVGIPSNIIAIVLARRSLGITVPLREVSRIYLSVLFLVPLALAAILVPVTDILRLVFVIGIAPPVYLLSLAKTKALTSTDLDIIENLLEGQPILYHVAKMIIRIERPLVSRVTP